ncbi:Clr5 domain-containing protein [Xylariaceae sp. FL0255]|nr:Clr5 domain-containing protein [Xylariaceae sp. FL0255]
MASNDWERYKATIIRLYLFERVPLKDVISYMKEHHGFDRRKCHYEYQLKKWNVRKNADREVWPWVIHQVDKRGGRPFEVTLYDMPLSGKKVHKQMQRYRTIPTAEEFRTGSLHHPNAFLEHFLAAAGSIEIKPTGRVMTIVDSMWAISRNPIDFYNVARKLTATIPCHPSDSEVDATRLTNTDDTFRIVNEMLKVVFFRLSNNLDKIYDERTLQLHDELILGLFDSISHSNPQMLSSLFANEGATTKAVKEAVYGCAVRQRYYDIIERLLESGSGADSPFVGYLKQL